MYNRLAAPENTIHWILVCPVRLGRSAVCRALKSVVANIMQKEAKCLQQAKNLQDVRGGLASALHDARHALELADDAHGHERLVDAVVGRLAEDVVGREGTGSPGGGSDESVRVLAVGSMLVKFDRPYSDGETYLRKSICSHNICSQVGSVLPPPVSESMALRPFLRRNAASEVRASTLFLTHCACVPDESESRY